MQSEAKSLRMIHCSVCHLKGHRKGNAMCTGPVSEGKKRKPHSCSVCHVEGHHKGNKICKGAPVSDEKEEVPSEEEEEESSAKMDGVVERILFGNLVLCSFEGNYQVLNLGQVQRRNMDIPAPLPEEPRQLVEVFLNTDADEFAEARYGFYVAQVMFKEEKDTFVYFQAMDPHVVASYCWVPTAEIHEIRGFDLNLKVGDHVDVCRWEWQDNWQPVWCPAEITSTEGIYFNVTYDRPIRFKTEVKMDDHEAWQYGEPLELATEDNILGTRLRKHL